MKVIASSLRPGNVIESSGKLWQVLKIETTQPGKGGALAQLELRDIRGGNKDKARFRSQEYVERVRLDQEPHQYLYATDDQYAFMHQETFEQLELSGDVIGDPKIFLQEGMIVTIESYEGDPLSVELPDQVTMEVTEADAVVKGQTASSSYKPAMLENGARILVPPHIEAGTRVVVKTADGTYVERAKD